MGLEAATIAAIGAMMSGTAALATATKGGPGMQAPVTPEAPPQAGKTPDRESVKRKTSESVSAGAPSSTLLTGPAGVQLDAGILGKNTLLGG
jgi:hypothetical protein